MAAARCLVSFGALLLIGPRLRRIQLSSPSVRRGSLAQRTILRLIGGAMRAKGDVIRVGGEKGGKTEGLEVATCPRELILSIDQLEAWAEKLEKSSRIAIDVSSDSGDPQTGNIVGISIAIPPGEAAYIPVKHEYPNVEPQLSLPLVLSKILPLLFPGENVQTTKNQKLSGNLQETREKQNPKQPTVIIHDAKPTLRLLSQHAGRWLGDTGHIMDTMLMSYILNSTTDHAISSLSQSLLSLQLPTSTPPKAKRARKGGKGGGGLGFVNVFEALEQAASNAFVTLKLHDFFHEVLKKTDEDSDDRRWKLLTRIEIPVMRVLSEMESAGVLIDTGRLKRLSETYGEEIDKLTDEAYALAGEKFNLNSALQLQNVLFTKLGLPVTDRSKSGQPSTSEDVLQKLSSDITLKKNKLKSKGADLAGLVLKYRHLSKLKNTWLDTLPRAADSNSRVRCTFNQGVTSTGRLSASNPNLQNIPARSNEGKEIRQAFIAPRGYKMLSADYSQIELRVMANFSADPTLLSAFRAGEDVHRATAAEIFHVKPENVSSEMRRRAKAINFGLIYGMSSYGLAAQIQVREPEARAMVSTYFKTYPGVQGYMNKTLEEARKRGYVSTLYGRRIHVPGVVASRMAERRAAERVAINAPVQGTAADLIKVAMVNLSRRLKAINTILTLYLTLALTPNPNSNPESLAMRLRHAE
ncbi:hypothetical protein AAMO2058_000956400 [Amorphochlora amoebiformis]